jgi:hypothetical protein
MGIGSTSLAWGSVRHREDQKLIKTAPKRALSSPGAGDIVRKLSRVVDANYQGDVFARYAPDFVFKTAPHGSKDFSRSAFGDLTSYVLSDQPIDQNTQIGSDRLYAR